jgi:hypothetical protein
MMKMRKKSGIENDASPLEDRSKRIKSTGAFNKGLFRSLEENKMHVIRFLEDRHQERRKKTREYFWKLPHRVIPADLSPHIGEKKCPEN